MTKPENTPPKKKKKQVLRNKYDYDVNKRCRKRSLWPEQKTRSTIIWQTADSLSDLKYMAPWWQHWQKVCTLEDMLQSATCWGYRNKTMTRGNAPRWRTWERTPGGTNNLLGGPLPGTGSAFRASLTTVSQVSAPTTQKWGRIERDEWGQLVRGTATVL